MMQDSTLQKKEHDKEEFIFRRNIQIGITFVFTIFFIWIYLLSEKSNKQQIKIDKLDSLYQDCYFSFVDSNEKTEFLVTASTYNPTINQCDASPFITAYGYKIDSLNPFKHKYIGLSSDLQIEFEPGERVILENAGMYNGEYKVADKMNTRHYRFIDILIGKKQYNLTIENVILKHKN